MKSIGLFTTLAGTLFLFGGGAGESGKADREKLRGAWSTLVLVHNGKTLLDEKNPSKEAGASKLVYEGAAWRITLADKTVAKGVFTIDATKTPKEIDILDETGARNEKTKLGIYELDGDVYKYVLAPAGKPRPKEMKSAPGSGDSFAVMKRDK